MNLVVSEILITYFTNRGKARVMLQILAGHSNNCQIILKLFRYDIFCNNLQHKKIKTKLGGIRSINHLHYKWGRARVMLHIGSRSYCNNCQIMLKLFRYDIFCNNL